MTKFSWAKAIGFGALVWAVMFVVASAIIAFGATFSVGWSIALAFLAGLVSYMLATNVKAKSSGQAFSYGLVWAGIGLLLDLVVTRQFQSDIYSVWPYWMGYALIVLAPWFKYGVEGVGTYPEAA